ncbi:MAG: hypothetical protein ACFB21_15135 [Opitutales bacterium]
MVLDFFAGSGTTAHAVMAVNAEDRGNRRWIQVQLPERIESARYDDIFSLAVDRVRLAGSMLKQEHATTAATLDTGFRVLKVDTSNVREVYYRPDEVKQDELGLQIDHLKEDRTPEDLLFQVMLDWGVDLSLPIREESIAGKQVWWVDDNAIAACFETDISDTFVKELAERQPLRAVFRDSGYATDAVKINITEIFKRLSPGTEVKTL